jgi:alkane 1-monooxygenase
MMPSSLRGFGYLFCFLPLLSFWLGLLTRWWVLAPVLFFVVLPLARFIVGDLKATTHRPLIPIWQTQFLNALPRVYVWLWVVSFVLLGIYLFSFHSMLSALDWLGLGVSYWIVTSINMTIGHELIHRKQPMEVFWGRLLTTTSGHCYFVEEHRDHHVSSRFTGTNDSSLPGETVYHYIGRHFFESLGGALRYERHRLLRRNLSFLHNEILKNLVILTCIVFSAAFLISPLAAFMYVLVSLCTIVTVQVMTYIQHWGLKDSTASWEDGCIVQSFVILNHALHEAHHNRPSLPYFFLTLTPASPKLPTGYAVLFLLSFFPRVFTAVMNRALLKWSPEGSASQSDTPAMCFKV